MIGINLGASYKNLYFIGIGGVHMSGLAELLHLSGYSVSGSDARPGETVNRLKAINITVYTGHNEKNVPRDADLVVYTSAVKNDNPELAKARALGIPVIDRAKLLGLTMKNYDYPVCVSGVHGKTTTTSMISEIFLKAELDPTIMNGGVCPSVGGSMRKGSRKFFIAEADEYYDAFLKSFPFVGVILNIEKDHTDYFKTLATMRDSFKSFAERVHEHGALVINNRIENLEEITWGLNCRVITYSTKETDKCDWAAHNIVYDRKGRPSFDAVYKGKPAGRIALSVPGLHNVENSLAALAACAYLGVPFEKIAGGLLGFTGAVRRFEYKGEMNGASVVDDYAHHPTEIRATLKAAKNINTNRTWCVFQPHTRSRTKELIKDFAESFYDADKIVLLDIFMPSGREEDNICIHSMDLMDKLRERGLDAQFFPTFSEAADFLRNSCEKDDLIITMGAGDVYKLGESLITTIK